MEYWNVVLLRDGDHPISWRFECYEDAKDWINRCEEEYGVGYTEHPASRNIIMDPIQRKADADMPDAVVNAKVDEEPEEARKIVTFDELKPGMLIAGYGLIAEVSAGSDDDIWGNKPHIAWYDINDSYHGPVSQGGEFLREKKYVLMCEKGSEEYERIVAQVKDSVQQMREDTAEWLTELDELAQ